ncbi:hypothetical protein FB451DRAFT_1553513 [Mycena latifolia]|nr:hypothetical protein FB451DRAFT_1553513 [Mycena latifolia]
MRTARYKCPEYSTPGFDNGLMSLSAFSFSSTAEEVAEAFAGEIQGKNILITGTSINGMGFETARVVAKGNAKPFLRSRLKLSEDAIKKELPSANIRSLALDLSSLADVRRAAAEVNAYPEPIHVCLDPQRGAVIGPFKLTVDNLESQMATDHIGPFLLTKLFAPKLLAAGTEPSYVPRVVFLSSEGHAHGSGAKSANVLTAIELCKRSNGRINAYSVDPGMIHTNILQKEESIALIQGFDPTRNDVHCRLPRPRRKTQFGEIGRLEDDPSGSRYVTTAYLHFCPTTDAFSHQNYRRSL